MSWFGWEIEQANEEVSNQKSLIDDHNNSGVKGYEPSWLCGEKVLLIPFKEDSLNELKITYKKRLKFIPGIYGLTGNNIKWGEKSASKVGESKNLGNRVGYDHKPLHDGCVGFLVFQIKGKKGDSFLQDASSRKIIERKLKYFFFDNGILNSQMKQTKNGEEPATDGWDIRSEVVLQEIGNFLDEFMDLFNISINKRGWAYDYCKNAGLTEKQIISGFK